MLKIKISFLVMALLMLNSVGTAACAIEQSERSQNTKRTKNKNAPAKPTPAPAGETDVKQDEIKVLAEGTQSRMNDAFVAVARDPETYAALKIALAASLPEMGGDFFNSFFLWRREANRCLINNRLYLFKRHRTGVHIKLRAHYLSALAVLLLISSGECGLYSLNNFCTGNTSNFFELS